MSQYILGLSVVNKKICEKLIESQKSTIDNLLLARNII